MTTPWAALLQRYDLCGVACRARTLARDSEWCAGHNELALSCAFCGHAGDAHYSGADDDSDYRNDSCQECDCETYAPLGPKPEEPAQVDRLPSYEPAPGTSYASGGEVNCGWFSPGQPCHGRVKLRDAELAAERARPRPKVEIELSTGKTMARLIVTDMSPGELGLYHKTADLGGPWKSRVGARVALHATEAEARAALVDAAEAAGFDVSACRGEP